MAETEADRSDDGRREAGVDLDRLWAAFGAPADGADFLRTWLALLCRRTEGIQAAILLAERPEGGFAPAAVWPERLQDATHLSAVARRALAERAAVTEPSPRGVAMALPIGGDGAAPRAILVADVAERPGPGLGRVTREIYWGTGWLEATFARVPATGAGAGDGLQPVFDLVAATVEEKDFDGAALAFVNEVASRCGHRLAALGWRSGGRIRLKALSQTAWQKKASHLAEALEMAMEEAFAQNRAVVDPPLAGAERSIAAAHATLRRTREAAVVASVVLTERGTPVGVLLVERDGASAEGEAPFTGPDLETLELAAAAVGPVLALKAKARRWIAGRLVDLAAIGLQRTFGPRHTGFKLAATAAAIALAALALVEAPLRVSAPATLEGSVQRAVVAPFDGFVATAPVRAGDLVAAGTVMASLDDRDLVLERLRWQAERQEHVQRKRDALAEGERSAMSVADAEIAKAEAQLALVEEKLARARIVAPVDGLVVSGDLSQQIGAPLEKGAPMFQVAPLDGYRVVIEVSELDVRLVEAGQAGELQLAAREAPLPIRVLRVTPVSSPKDGRNAFRVEGVLDELEPGLRPGMAGVAKLETGTAPLIWTLARGTVDRLRLLLWKWSP